MKGYYSFVRHTIERLHVTSQTLRNHFRVAEEVCQHTHSTHNVVGVDAKKHVQLPINSESTGLVVLQWFNRVALTIAQLELLRRPRRAGTPFYLEVEFRLWLNRKDFHSTCLRSVPCNCIVYIAVGGKKDDPLSPTYLPSLLSFTLSLKGKIAEQSMYRCTASKGRKLKSGMKLLVTMSVMHSTKRTLHLHDSLTTAIALNQCIW